ncbi:hypothetical protein GCM10027355_02490 [Haloplanus salinarum]
MSIPNASVAKTSASKTTSATMRATPTTGDTPREGTDIGHHTSPEAINVPRDRDERP